LSFIHFFEGITVSTAKRTSSGKERFVRVYQKGSFPNISNVRGSNFCDIGVRLDKRTGRVVIISAIDNLVKGASGQAVQNMNIMYGFPEDTALKGLPFFP